MVSAPQNNEPPQKNSDLRPLMRLLPYLLRHKLHLVAATIFLVCAGALTLILPRLIGTLLDSALEGSSEQINTGFHWLYTFAAALALASSLRYYFVMWLGERVVADVRSNVFEHLTKLDMSFYDQSRSGELISRLTADTTQIKSAFGASASLAIRNTILCVGAIIMMVWSIPSLAAIMLFLIPLLLTPLILIGRRVRKRSKIAQTTLAEATALAAETVTTIKTHQAFNNEALAAATYDGATQAAFDDARKSLVTRSVLSGLAIFVIFASITGTLWLGAQRVGAGELAAGTLASFVFYAAIAAGTLATLSEVWGELQLAAGAADRLIELLSLTPVIAAPQNAVSTIQFKNKEAITFKAVNFNFENSNTSSPILTDLNFSVKTGETIAIVGASGAGKSTLINLLLRFYDPISGEISLHGTPINQLAPSTLREALAYVAQDPAIFAQSIAQNIAFGNEQIDLDKVKQAAKAARAHEFIEQLQDGYHAAVGERGVTLSGGQRQRIAIARALYKDAPILLLDEATSALDAESETLVQDAIETLMQGRTTLVIAHRLATILGADKIMVMDKGKIVETGSHESLIAQGGIYAKLAKLQFERGAKALDAAQ